MTRRFKVGVVGGGIGTQHIEAYRQLTDQFEVAAFCDIDAAKAQSVGERYGIAKVRSSLEDLLTERGLDIIDICTPSSLHLEQTRAALLAGRHVICEKPIGGSLAEIDELVRVEAETGRRVCPIFQYRFGDGFRRLQHLGRKGVLGKAYIATIETHWKRGPVYYTVPWRGRWATELGGTLIAHAIHAHDLLVTALGPIRRVFARTATRVNPIETEDCAALSLEMESGALVASSVTVGSAVEISRLRFCFERVTVESNHAPYRPDQGPWQFIPMNDEAAARIEAAFTDFEPMREHFVGELGRLHMALCGEGDMPVSLADARASIELLTAAYHSARTGTEVTLPLAPDHVAYAGWQPDRRRG